MQDACGVGCQSEEKGGPYMDRDRFESNSPQEEALDRLVDLIKADGAWQEP